MNIPNLKQPMQATDIDYEPTYKLEIAEEDEVVNKIIDITLWKNTKLDRYEKSKFGDNAHRIVIISHIKKMVSSFYGYSW